MKIQSFSSLFDCVGWAIIQEDAFFRVEVLRCFQPVTYSMRVVVRAVFRSSPLRAVAAVDAANCSDARTATPFTDRQVGGSSQLPAENDLSEKTTLWLITENHMRRHILRMRNSILFFISPPASRFPKDQVLFSTRQQRSRSKPKASFADRRFLLSKPVSFHKDDLRARQVYRDNSRVCLS